MIEQGLPFPEVNKEYMRKFGKPLSRSTYGDWKKNSESIINSGTSAGVVRSSYTLPDVRKQFDEDLFAELDKTEQDVEGQVGIKLMAIKLAASEKYKDNETIQGLCFERRYVERIIKQYNMKITAALSTTRALTDAEEVAEIARLSALMLPFDDSRIWNCDEVSHALLYSFKKS